jgi:glycosyltransferase involved in cell wall biosynthesis
MTLAFYYHIPIYVTNNQLYCPGYLGIFIDGLAKEVDNLILFLHESQSGNFNDYQIQSTNIIFVNLGQKTASWHRMFYHQKILKQKILQQSFDAMLVRTPSPLAPFFSKYISNKKLFYFIVGDYKETAIQTPKNNLRDWIIYCFNRYMDYILLQKTKNNHVFVNSPILLEKFNKYSLSSTLIKTSTLSNDDFFEREDTCQEKCIHLLYTGRLDFSKGLKELIEATALLLKTNFSVQLHIVGWEEDPKKPVEQKLLAYCKELNIESNVIFHGKKAIGKELNAMYRMADIFVIPSYQEGFPRVIWEAMANSLPVIATNVGGIPKFLKHQENAILIEPKSSQLITDAVLSVFENKQVRQKIINNGFLLANETKISIQSKIIKNNIYEKIL